MKLWTLEQTATSGTHVITLCHVVSIIELVLDPSFKVYDAGKSSSKAGVASRAGTLRMAYYGHGTATQLLKEATPPPHSLEKQRKVVDYLVRYLQVNATCWQPLHLQFSYMCRDNFNLAISMGRLSWKTAKLMHGDRVRVPFLLNRKKSPSICYERRDVIDNGWFWEEDHHNWVSIGFYVFRWTARSRCRKLWKEVPLVWEPLRLARQTLILFSWAQVRADFASQCWHAKVPLTFSYLEIARWGS